MGAEAHGMHITTEALPGHALRDTSAYKVRVSALLSCCIVFGTHSLSDTHHKGLIATDGLIGV